jgi:hypothetical protein
MPSAKISRAKYGKPWAPAPAMIQWAIIDPKKYPCSMDSHTTRAVCLNGIFNIKGLFTALFLQR